MYEFGTVTPLEFTSGKNRKWCPPPPVLPAPTLIESVLYSLSTRKPNAPVGVKLAAARPPLLSVGSRDCPWLAASVNSRCDCWADAVYQYRLALLPSVRKAPNCCRPTG